MTNEKKFRDLLTTLFTNNISNDGGYIIPFRFTQKNSKGQPIDPFVPTEEAYNKQLDEIVVWAENTLKDYKGISWDADSVLFELIFRQLFYDGKGFMIPYFKGYINRKTEHQKPNDELKDHFGNPIPIYNFDKDTASAQFFTGLFYHLNDWEKWLKDHAEKLGSHPDEFIDEKNTDAGVEELKKPYEKLIEGLQNKKGE